MWSCVLSVLRGEMKPLEELEGGEDGVPAGGKEDGKRVDVVVGSATVIADMVKSKTQV